MESSNYAKVSRMKTTKTIEIYICDNCKREHNYRGEGQPMLCSSCKCELCPHCNTICRAEIKVYVPGNISHVSISRSNYCHACMARIKDFLDRNGMDFKAERALSVLEGR